MYNHLFRLVVSSPSSWMVSVSLWHAHSGVVVFHYPSRGQKYTRLCPYCYGSILGPSYSCHLNIAPRETTTPPLRPPVTSPGLLLSWIPSSLNASTSPLPGIVHLCYPLTLPPPRIRSVPGMPSLSVAVNLHWLRVSNGLQPMLGWPPPTLPNRALCCLRSCSLTVLMVVLGSQGGVFLVEDGVPW